MSTNIEAGSSAAEVHMQWGVKIPLRDGIHLFATVYLPHRSTNPSPAVFTLTPYIGQTYHDRGLYFAAHGYPFLTVDVRGRGNSEGVFNPHINEARDGHDVVEWLAQQSYCNGQVAMWGGSYGGLNQWSTAKELPPHLATIVPVAAPYIGVDFPMCCNITSPYVMQWLTLVSGRTSQDRLFSNQEFWGKKFREWLESGMPFKELDRFLGNRSEIFQEWIAHPHQDPYWDRYNPTSEQYAKIAIPILTITGSYDGDQPGALTHYREHMKTASAAVRSRHYLVIGPWDHAGTRSPQPQFAGLNVGPASLTDLGALHVQWYAWTMQGGPKPSFLQNQVMYYVMGAERWRSADSLDAITARRAPYYLHSTGNPTDVLRSGHLNGDPPAAASEPDQYVYDPHDVSMAALESTVDPENLVDQRMVYASVGKHLVYHSAPFERDVEISGFFELSAWISIDQPDTDFRVSVYEIAIDGSAILLTTDSMRARHRQSLRDEKLIRTTDPLRYDFNRFMFVSRWIRAGNRLRLVFGLINSIYWQKNYNSGGIVSKESMKDARSVAVRLFHDQAHPSVLYVPFGQSEAWDVRE